MKKNQHGFGAIEAILTLIIVAVIGFVGWYVWKQNQKPADQKSTNSQQSDSKNQNSNNEQAKADPYDGWLSCKDAAAGLTFKYSETWSTAGTTKDNPCGLTVGADASMDGADVQLRTPGKGVKTSFKLFYSSAAAKGTYNFVDSSYKGETVLDVVSLNVPNAPKPLSAVVYASNNYPTKAAGIVLTDQTYTVGQKISGSIPFAAAKNGGKSVNMTVSLATHDNNQSKEYNYTLDEYKNHSDYQSVMNMFKSLSY